MVWYGMIWYGMVWCGVVWYGRCLRRNTGLLKPPRSYQVLATIIPLRCNVQCHGHGISCSTHRAFFLVTDWYDFPKGKTRSVEPAVV